MQICDLSKNDINDILYYYFEHKKDFKTSLYFEDFIEEFCHRCDSCGKVICNLNGCEECDSKKEIDDDWEYFDRNKEHYVYGLY